RLEFPSRRIWLLKGPEFRTEGSDISGGIQISIDLEAATLELEGLRHCVFDAIQLEMLWFASL
ncbi:MAG TPA: hypothetical protein PKV83_06695, partial [Methanothrix sp.]|nr:hypothetical protein [Methanothrix sp.]